MGASLVRAQDTDQIRLLEVQVNGHPIGQIGQFTMRHGSLYATRSELQDLGIRCPLAHASGGHDAPVDELIALSELPKLTWRLDSQTQTLYITSPNEGLLSSVLHDDNPRGSSRRKIISGNGVTLNYDVVGTAIGHQIGSSSSLDMRVFTSVGVASAGLLTYTGRGQGSLLASAYTIQSPLVRLDTAYTFADVNTLRRYSVGDFITGGLSWTRPIRLTGIQVRSDFSMRPDLITFPLPTIAGTAAVPSTVNVLANGNQVLSRDVDAGPFQIPQLPVINGASSISMTVTNALGQQVTITQPFYASTLLLAKGLQTFSAQAGLVRREWGTVSNNYGKLAAVGNYRRGLTPWLTAEGSVEVTPGTAMGGGGAVIRVGNFGVFNASGAASGGGGLTGMQGSTGFQRIGTSFNFGASGMFSTRGYQDVAAINGDAVIRRQLSGNGSVFLRRFGSLGIAFAQLKQDAPVHPLYQFAIAAQDAKVLSASYTLQLRRLSFHVNEFRNFSNTDGNGFQAGITIPCGRQTTVDVSEGNGAGFGQVRVQKSASLVGDWGYNAYVSAVQPVHEFAQVIYKSLVGLFTVGIDQDGSQNTVRTES